MRLEAAVVVKVRPVVQTPEQSVQVVGREPERVARARPVRVQPVGRVVDAPRRERLFVGQAQPERVNGRQLSRQELGRTSAQHEDHPRRVRAVDRRVRVPPGAAAPLERVARAPRERVEDPLGSKPRQSGCSQMNDPYGGRGVQLGGRHPDGVALPVAAPRFARFLAPS